MGLFDPEVFLPVIFVTAYLLTATGVWLYCRRRLARRPGLLDGNAHLFPFHSCCLSLTVECPGF